jgi:hypothetical protein
MILYVFTLLHVLLSVAGIVGGLVVVYGFLVSKRLDGWTFLFLSTTMATVVTGLIFPFRRLLPSHVVGVLSLILLTIAIAARYRYFLAGSWRWIYVVTAVGALYLNVFVLVVQLFSKIPALKAVAPPGTERPFLVVQGLVLGTFTVLGIAAAFRFRMQLLRFDK